VWQELPPHTNGWTEEDWEQFFDEQDRQLRDTDAGESNRVGATREAETVDFEDPEHWCSPEETMLLEAEASESEDTIMEDDSEDLLDRELNEIPAWRSAVEFGDRVYEYVWPHCRSHQGGPRQYIMRTLCTESYLVQDYLAAGHEIGYEEDTLCGNIALCNRALSSLERCTQCLDRAMGIDDDQCAALVTRAHITKSFLLRRIDELRNMVWWR
jgi:hypothetical protein